ncbi:STE20-related kinase adapter protein alpha-like [Symsagittifera roscoffensis]|uniref:STE20-related kinase adapter protein alpha-like n=1 Tax=Symsagittifera roscoffensis TaxID=84072 RepID=UPI00307C7801
MISFLPQHMAIQITPHYFPSGRFGPMILDSQLDHLHPPLLGSKSEEEYIGYKSNNSKPKSHKSTRSTVSDRNNQKLVVRKMVNLLEIEDDLLEQLKHEVLTLRKLCHPNILPIYSAEIEGSNLFIAMPFAERGCCRFILEKHFEYGFKEKLVRHILTSVLSAVFYLHVNSIIHTRICSRNVLLSLQGHVYLTGFEYAQSVAQTAGMLFDLPKDIIDYLPWTAPEVLAQDTRGFSFPADIYSVGALGVELNNGVPPFTDPTNPLAPSLIMLEKLKGFTPRLLDSSTINEDTLTVLEEGQMTDESAQMDMLVFKQRTLSQDYHQLVNTCCRTSPWTRPTAEQLLKSCPFTNPIEQKRMSGSGELESELPIIDLPVDEKTTEEGEGEVSGGNNKSTTSVITTGGGTQLGTFETIEEENESQLSSHLPPEDGLSSLNALSAATPQGLWGSFWNF